MPREFFTQVGEKVPKSKLNEYDEDAKFRIQAERKDAELERILGKVNFDELEGVFEDVLRRYGIKKRDMNFLREDMISRICMGKGQYRTETNVIGLNYFEIMKRRDGVNPNLEILKHLCHEETHAVSDNKCIGLKEFESTKPEPGDEYYSVEKSGYSQVTKTGKYDEGETQKSKRIFEYFNEGVVEKLSKEIFDNYLDRHKEYISTEERNKYTDYYKENPDEVAYSKDIKLIDALINRISNEIGFNEKEVWKSLIKGLLKGDEFNDEELKGEFSEMFSDDFLERLSEYKTQEQYEKLMKEIVGDVKAGNKQEIINENKLTVFLRKLGFNLRQENKN